jgi:hypothetical protein
VSTLPQATDSDSPRLWIRRLLVFESQEKRDTPLRDISFHRGLNIVWGVELPDDAGIDDAHPVTLSGHSVGKTTLCRLIRYCLGESTFGNPGVMIRIRSTFPNGWVGMELMVGGQEWSVLRPFGHAREPKAGKGISLQQIFDLHGEQNSFSEFLEHLQSGMMGGHRANRPPNSVKTYEWKHLLAWMARDQEARFQNLHDWRSSRSGADTPRFDKPKEHALYLIRLVLDLVQDEELRVAGSISETEKELVQQESRIAELQNEPKYRLNAQEQELKKLLGVQPEDTLNADESDLMSPIAMRRTALMDSVLALQGEIEAIDRQIAEKRVWLASYDEQQRVFRDAMDTTAKATEQPEAGRPEDDTIQKLRGLRGKDCVYGNIPFNECSYVVQRVAEAAKIIDLSKKREDRRVVSATERRVEILQQQRKDHDQIVALLDELRGKLNKDTAEKYGKERKLVEQRTQLQRLDDNLAQRKMALALREGRTPNTQLEKGTVRAAELRSTVERQKEELQRHQESYQQRLSGISEVYDRLVKGALSTTYSGRIEMTRGEVQFQIFEAGGLSGEAVETLALVLADVAALVCSCRGIGHHPRFLMHDSPREADLDRHIYNRYLRMMMNMTAELGGREAAPFQYIVTTTSRPPPEMHDAICLHLRGHPQSEMLFKCVLRNPESAGILDFSRA